MTCPQCHGLGWVLDGDASKAPLALELLPCLLPDCEASGRDIEILSLNTAGLRHAFHWRDMLMSVSRAWGVDVPGGAPGGHPLAPHLP